LRSQRAWREIVPEPNPFPPPCPRRSTGRGQKDDVLDFSARASQAALSVLRNITTPLFTAAFSEKPTISIPGIAGGPRVGRRSFRTQRRASFIRASSSITLPFVCYALEYA